MSIDNISFKNLLDFLHNKKILITTHDSVDIDGYSSCIVLQFFLQSFFTSENICVMFGDINSSTNEFIEKWKAKFPDIVIELNQNKISPEIDIILVLDTNNLEMVRFLEDNIDNYVETEKVFIDHHYLHESSSINDNNLPHIINDDISSTAEIVFELIKYIDIEIPSPYMYLLAAGILKDSGFFKHGSNETIDRINSILTHYKLDFQEIRQILNYQKDISETIAVIKGCQRVIMTRFGEILVGVSHVSTFAATVANALKRIGFDVGIVYSKKKDRLIISTRAKKSMTSNPRFHLGEILEEVSSEFGLTGGGHDGAASLHGKINPDFDIEALINRILAKIEDTLD